MDRLRRLEPEATAASTLSHSDIITIRDITKVEDLHILVTLLIEVETLRNKMAGTQ